MYIQPIIEGQYFHIYNRGVNGENLFKEERNYHYFLQQYKLYCSDVLETLAYCLLKNHFHLLAYVKENVELPRRDGQGIFKMNASKQLGHLFNSYSQAINKAHQRTGPLFESPFERKWVDKHDYLKSVFCYGHHNARHHGFVNDFRDWEFSSYHDIIRNDNTWLAAEKVIQLFGDVAAFERAHMELQEDKEAVKYIIE